MPIAACAFDLYGTLVDVHGEIERRARSLGLDAHVLSQLWRRKQLEYTWTLELMGRRLDFEAVTERALDYSLAELGIDVRPAERSFLLEGYDSLAPDPDAARVLETLRGRGVRTAVLSNGTREMIDAGVAAAGLAGHLDVTISVEEIGVYKPDPRVYALGCERLGVSPGGLGFVSANAWDAAGAAAAGLEVVWLSRGGPAEYGLADTASVIESIAEVPRALLGERR